MLPRAHRHRLVEIAGKTQIDRVGIGAAASCQHALNSLGQSPRADGPGECRFRLLEMHPKSSLCWISEAAHLRT